MLRDIMVCDRLVTNASGRLPKVLQVYDPALKKLSKKMTALCRPPGIRRGYALLYSENCLVYADYKEKILLPGNINCLRKLLLKGKINSRLGCYFLLRYLLSISAICV